MDGISNFAYSTIVTAPNPGASGTSLTVQTGDGALFPAAPFNAFVLPAVGRFPIGGASMRWLKSQAEIVRVTAIASNTFTIARAQEGSTARNILVGDQIVLAPTAKTFTDIAAHLLPSDLNLLAMNFDPAMITNTTGAPTAGVPWHARIPVRGTITVSKIMLALGTAGSGGSPANCFAGLYNAAGQQLGVSADLTTAWTTSGNVGMLANTITVDNGQSLTIVGPTVVFVSVLVGTQSTTAIQFARYVPQVSGFADGLLAAADGYRAFNLGSAKTTLPTSIVIANGTRTTTGYWAGLA